MDPIEYMGANAKYAIYAMFGITILIAILAASAAAIALSIILLLCSVIYSHSSHVINPIIARRSGIVLAAGGYSLGSNLKAATKPMGGGYKAVCVAVLSTGSRITNEGKKFEEIISKCGFPFEFTVQIKNIEMRRVTEALETRRRMKEIELSRTRPSKSESISRIKRELSAIEGDIEALTSGRLPVEAIVRVRTTATAATEAEAARGCMAQAKQLCELFSVTYSLGYRMLIGEELLRSIVD
ncbi:MAG: hypothetical protein KGH59_03860 [Candidatus Micrarchaeota archaeon]|nr:hypothetical protein [Candidatus Micrarchaeota archaeon]MDE1846649.1 hypothetical protein [Candidatus Micrarchaeota archaeon]